MNTASPLDEFAIIRRYFTRDPLDDSVVLTVGDDGAITRPTADHELVTVTDTLVEGVHFPADLDAADIGFRAVAVNLSDIAAMAATPRWMTLALTLGNADGSWLQSFASGLFDAADAFGVSLVGGDTTRGPASVITVQVTGEVPAGRGLRRSGAAVGDDIYVSGHVGDAAAGLALVPGDAGSEAERYLRERFCRPSPRIELGESLRALASAAIDVSDGLYADLSRLLQSSAVGGTLDLERLPLSDALTAVCGRDKAVRLALSGGDDYELCFTVPPAAREPVDKIARQLALSLTRIGNIGPGPGLKCLQNGADTGYHDAGFRHFR